MADFSETERFQVGIAMHFCGMLTDLALGACLRQHAAFAFCPCCYGKVALNVVEVQPAKGQEQGLFVWLYLGGLFHLWCQLWDPIRRDVRDAFLCAS